MKEIEFLEDTFRSDARDLGSGVMRERDRRVNFSLSAHSRDLVLQVLPQDFTFVQEEEIEGPAPAES
jgi:hypothetical protein